MYGLILEKRPVRQQLLALDKGEFIIISKITYIFLMHISLVQAQIQ
jgi:hypothetical protein